MTLFRMAACLMPAVCGPLGLAAQIRFSDVTEAAGIRHQFVVYEGMFGGGICVFDVNRDGYEDLYITGGMNDDVLYLNQKDGTFKNILEGSGLELTKKYVTQGVAGADVNRDGWVDLFITTNNTKNPPQEIPRAPNLFFLNNGNNTFRDATAEYGIDRLHSFSTGASFGDFNADGYPDLYVGNYFQDYDGPLTEINDATIVNAGKTAEGYLLLNKQGKGFEDVYGAYGLRHKGFGFGGVFTDYDNDGDLDLIVNHDFGYKAKPNYLLRNEYPDESFTYVEKALGMDLRINAMTAAVGDYDNNGLLDYFITNIKFNRFMVNQGADKPFRDMLKESGMSMFTISWGANFADFDHDGDLDLFVANGDLNPNCVPMGDFLFENLGGKFQDIGRAAGVNDYGMGRGSVIFDLENDGDMDLLVVNQKPVKDYPMPSVTKLFRNERNGGNWLKVALSGVESDKNGLGARIRIVLPDGRQMIRETDGGGSSHLSQNSPLVHFGLGNAVAVDSLIVTWPGGNRQVLTKQAANQLLSITEIPGPKKKKAFPYGYAAAGAIALLLLFFLLRNKKVTPGQQ